MPTEEIEGGIAGIHGKRLKEFTERYEFLKDGIAKAEKVMRDGECSPEDIGSIYAARAMVNDLSPSKERGELKQSLEKALETCSQKGYCKICREEDLWKVRRLKRF